MSLFARANLCPGFVARQSAWLRPKNERLENTSNVSTPTTFELLLSWVGLRIAKSGKRRAVASPGERLCVTLRYLVTGDAKTTIGSSYRPIDNTVGRIIRETSFSNQTAKPQRRGDPVFAEAGKAPGLTVWRVENFALKKVANTELRTFYTGDSYVVLKCEGKSPPFSCHIHFWLGKKTSQDEAGTAALKSVELDDLLGGAPTQYREIQHHESRRFLSYFPKGIKYEEGGVRSGFNEADVSKRKRLMQVKGKKRVRVYEVACHCDSLNYNDVFILDNGACIWLWIGRDSCRAEQRKAMEVAKAIRDDDRDGGGINEQETKIIIVEDDPTAHPMRGDKRDPINMFYDALGSYGPIKNADNKRTDEVVEREKMKNITLHRVKVAESNGVHGQLRVIEEGTGDLKYAMLDSDDTFVLDTGGLGLWVRVGAKSSNEEKLQGMKIAVNFLRSKQYPDYTQVVMVKEGHETWAFKQCFVDWPTPIVNPMSQVFRNGRGIAQSVPQVKYDVSKMHLHKKRLEEKLIPAGRDDKVDVWRVENFKLVPQTKEGQVGTFFGGDCYVVLYTYTLNRKECYIIYYWLGNQSTTDERGTAAAMTVKMDESLGGAAVQVRVVQGKEPLQFLKIFNNSMIVYQGGKASGFRGHQQEARNAGGVRLFQVRGQAGLMKALEVEPIAASLNSNDVFVLDAQQRGFLWYGKGCIGDERERAKVLAMRVAPGYADEFVVVPEGQEPQGFWDLLGGRAPYASASYLEEEIPEYPPRLFWCSTASGRFDVEELLNFTQQDLDEDDVMILDTNDTVFIWLGNRCTETERKLASKTAMDYIVTDPSGRDPENVQKLVVKQGFEPINFTGCFPGWDSTMFSDGKTYEQLKKEFNNENVGVTLVEDYIKEFSLDRKLPLHVLQEEVMPNGVDPTRKEYYLSPEEFESTFNMSLAQYDQLPQWKKDNLKKAVHLF